MAWTDRGKKRLAQEGFDSGSIWVAFYTGQDVELQTSQASAAGFMPGYARHEINPNDLQAAINSAGTQFELTNRKFWVASGDSSEPNRAQKIGIHDHATADQLLVDVAAISRPPPQPPTQGQTVMGSITISI